ncbi:MAG: FAD-dependent oxidoreductase [Candidatus Saccharimonadales bacterium]
MKVVIVGGGFAGIKAALRLAKDDKVHVTIVSDRDYFLFYPALYATATGGNKRQSVLPLADIFEGTSVSIVQDTVVGIDETRKILVMKDRQLDYDRVVFALGVVTSYFGIAGLDTYSYSIKSTHEIDRFKKHLHDELIQNKHLDKNYIVVGAGPTGVELSASLTHYLETISKKHSIKHAKIHLSLVEAAPRVLPRMSERASELVTARLKKLGIKVMTNNKVQSEDDDSIIINGKDIPSQTVVWTSGVANHPFFTEHSDIFRLAPNGKVIVDDQLKVSKHIYVIGDNAGTAFSGLAQTAIFDGIFVAKTISAEAHHKTLPRYSAKKQPVVIPVGHNWAILEYGWIRITGPVASFIRKCADMIGYLDFVSLPEALGLFLAKPQREEDCEICRL